MVELLCNQGDCRYNKKIQISKKEYIVQKKLPSLKSQIKSRQRKEIIKKIFKNNEKDFDTFIQELEIVKSWHEALYKVEVEFQKRNIYLHEPNAILFTNILYNRYFPDDDKIHM